MARIRTIKPEFFRHEELQAAEVGHPGEYPMMVYAGLWTQCDKQGVFPWKPKILKLDILPFLAFDMAKTLELLESIELVYHFEADGKEYGCIPTFRSHQRINGEEAKQQPRYPFPVPPTKEGSTKESGQKQEGSKSEVEERERIERKGKGNGEKGKDAPFPESSSPLPAYASTPEYSAHARIESARSTWNTAMPEKACRHLPINLRPEDRSDILRTLDVYSDAEVAEAVENYRRLLNSSRHEIRSPYQSFVGFMRAGVEKFITKAEPDKSYRRKLTRDEEEAATMRRNKRLAGFDVPYEEGEEEDI